MPRKKQYNIRLLLPGLEIRDAFRPSFVPGQPQALETYPWGSIDGATLYIGQIYSNPPDWIEFLRDQSHEIPANLSASGAGAILFVPAARRILALCFGHVHIALKTDAFVRQFGLKVTLNSVPRDRLRSIDTATLDAVTVQKRVQTSRDSDLQVFGVDMYNDLARLAAGTPSNSEFAQFVAGKDTLKIITTDESDEIQNLCDRVMEMYQSNTYMRDFAWVDRMKIVAEKTILAQLDAKVFEALTELRAGNRADLYMSPPEIVDYTEGSQLHYNGFGSRGKNFLNLSVTDYVAELNRCQFGGDMMELKEKHFISAKKSNGAPFSEKWKVYDCFTYETVLTQRVDADQFVLFSGNWYKVENNFKNEVEDAYNAIKKVSIVGQTNCQNERELIEYLLNNRPDLLKLDQVKINPRGVTYGNFEPCDFFSKNREFIHLKDGNSSGSISHLWAQGVVSAEAFVSDHDFKVKLRREVKTISDRMAGNRKFEKLFPTARQKLEREKYKVVYGIMRKPYNNGNLGIPFFSKISLQGAVRRIEELGISVAIELIQK